MIKAKRQRHDDHQPFLGALHVLELAAPLDRIARRHGVHGVGDPLLSLGDEAADVAAADVALHGDPSLAPFARDHLRAFNRAHVGQQRQGQSLVGRRQQAGCRRWPGGCLRIDSGRRPPAEIATGPRPLRPGICCSTVSTRSSTLSRKDAVAGDAILVDFDLQNRLALDLLGGQILAAGNSTRCAFPASRPSPPAYRCRRRTVSSATSARTPETISLMRCSIGCVNHTVCPGNVPSTSCISPTSSPACGPCVQ